MLPKTLAFFFMFFSVFGFKVGLLDLSLAIPAALLPLIIKSNPKIPRPFFFISISLAFLLTYQIAVQLLNNNIDFESPGRVARALISATMLGLFFSRVHRENAEEALKLLLLTIVVHAFLIILGALHQPTNELLSMLGGNERSRHLRSSGLFAGFDIAGFSLILGILLLIAPLNLLDNFFHRFLTLIILLAGSAFTSRVSMAICLILFFVFLITFILNSRSRFAVRATVFAISFPIVLLLAYWFAVVMEITFSLGILEVSQEEVEFVTSKFAAHTSEELLWASMFFLPESPINVLFGIGVEPGNSDVGYVREIFRYGLIGLILSVTIHFLFIFLCYRKSSRFYFFGYLPLIVILFLTLKNNYILVRGAFPAFMIITYCYGLLMSPPPPQLSKRDLEEGEPRLARALGKIRMS